MIRWISSSASSIRDICSPTGGQSGTVFVTYADGTVAHVQLTFADWYFNNPAPGTDIVATVPWNVPPEHPDQDHPVSVFYASLPLDPTKTVRFVTLPSNPNLHIFALAVGFTLFVATMMVVVNLVVDVLYVYLNPTIRLR